MNSNVNKGPRRLVELNIQDCDISYNIVDSLARLDCFNNTLRSLSFARCRYFTSRCLRRIVIADPKALTSLDISHTSVTDQGNAHSLVDLGLSNLYKRLTKLDILGLFKDFDSFELLLSISN